MFSRDRGSNLYYLASPVNPADGKWTGQVYVGNDKASGSPTLSYDVCLYYIDAVFKADLDARGAQALNSGLTKVPTVGTADPLACRLVTWNRPN
jgi:hypothetical protein